VTPAQAYGHPDFVTDVPIQGPTDEGMRRLACCWARTRLPQKPACVDCEGPTPMWTRHSLCLGNRLTNSGLGESIALGGSPSWGFSLGLDPGAAPALAALGLPAPGQCATASGYTVAVDPDSGAAAFSSAFGDPTTVVPFAQLAGNLQQGTMQAVGTPADLSAWNAAFAALAQAQGQAPYAAPPASAAYPPPGVSPAYAPPVATATQPPDWHRAGWDRRRGEWERRRRWEWARRFGAQPAAPPGVYPQPGFAPALSPSLYSRPHPGFRPSWQPVHPVPSPQHPSYFARGYGAHALPTAHPAHAVFGGRTAVHPSFAAHAVHSSLAVHPSLTAAARHAAASGAPPAAARVPAAAAASTAAHVPVASPHAAAAAAGRPALTTTAASQPALTSAATSQSALTSAAHVPVASHPAAAAAAGHSASTALTHAATGRLHGPGDPDVGPHLSPDQLAWVQHTLTTLNERILGSSGSSCPTWADPTVHLPAALGCFQTWWNANLTGAGKPGKPLRTDGTLDEDTLCALETITVLHSADFPHRFPDPGGQFCSAPAPLAHAHGAGLVRHWKGLSTPAKVAVGAVAAAAVGGVALAVVRRKKGRR